MRPKIYIFILMWLPALTSVSQSPADSLKLLLPITKSDSNKVWMLRDIAYYSLPESPDSAIYYGRRGAEFARTLGFAKGEIRNLYQVALAYEHKEDIDSALKIYRQTIRKADLAGEGKAKVDMLNAMGVAHYYSGNLSEAVKQYSLAYSAADSLGFEDQKGYSLNNMGVIYRTQGRFEKAIEVYRKSLKLKEVQSDSAGVVNSLYNIGLAQSFMERFEESLETLLRARTLAKFLEGRDADVANIDVGIGIAYYNQGQRELARKHLVSGLNSLGAEEPYTRAAGLSYLGILEVDDGLHEQGMQKIEESYNYAKKAGRLELLLQISRERAIVAEKLSDFPLASESWKAYSLLADSLRSRDIRSLREEMQARFELKEKELTIASQQWQIEQELSRYRRILIAALAFLILAVASAALAVLLRRRAVQLNHAVAAKEKALDDNELLLKEMHHRTKNNLQLLHSVFNLHRRGTDNKDAREVLQAGSESVEAIGLLHHHLYRSGDFRKVSLKPYLMELTAYFKSAFSLEERGIDLQLTCPDLEVDVDVAIPLGVVINELATNSLKYAFESVKRGCISLGVYYRDGKVKVALADNGGGSVGNETRNGTGNRLVELFGKKLNATLHRKSDEKGTLVELEFELPEKT